MQTGPAMGRHQLGTYLRQLRNARSMRLEDVAAKLDIAPSTISRIENGTAPVKTTYHAMLDLYRVDDPAERDHLTGMARAGQRRDWWVDHRSMLPDGLGTYLGMETKRRGCARLPLRPCPASRRLPVTPRQQARPRGLA